MNLKIRLEELSRSLTRIPTALVFAILGSVFLLHLSSNVTADDTFFESRIRPLLLASCIECHSDEHAEGGLSLESLEGWKEREVIVPGDPEQSLLIKAVRYEDPDLQMPPDGSGYERLSEVQIRDLEQWIRDGANDPRTSTGTSVGPPRRNRQFRITEHDLQHWAYQPIAVRPEFQKQRDGNTKPITASESAARIDQLHRENLEQHQMISSPAATSRELVRRAYFDLWGLPPSPEVVAEFERDPSDQAWANLIDRLLDSKHYGQRWGRYWLDMVRYAESNGYERDGPKPHAWRYRDYVIRAFNTDKPYDRFLIEQLAGDLLIRHEQLTPQQQPEQWRDATIATGYYRLPVWDDEPDSSAAAEFDELDDMLGTTATAVMGLTITCARCHDHKFDPFSQADYYSLLDYLRDIDPYGLPISGGGGRGTGRIEAFLCSDSELHQWQAEQQKRIQELEVQLPSTTEAEIEQFQAQIEQLKRQPPPFEQALVIHPPPQGRKATQILQRGDHQSPGEVVESTIPVLFRPLPIGESRRKGATIEDTTASPNRLDLAHWLTDPAHPLTARVMANRIWLHHFGSGIVPTVDDFGYTGMPPTNTALLDYLASQLIEQQWSIKSLHRAIMKSDAYRMSSGNSFEGVNSNATIDSSNQYFWRQNLRRLDAEAIRDSMLAYAGALNSKSAGPSVFTELTPEIRETANPVSLEFWKESPREEQDCRSVFLVVKRSLKDPLLESFDFANSHSPVGQRSVTTVAPQALMLLNDRFVSTQAERLAGRVLQETTVHEERLNHLWQIVYQRQPTANELALADSYLNAKQPDDSSGERGWIGLSRAILNSNEALFID